MTEAMNEVAPIVTKDMPMKWLNKPWMSDEVINRIKERDYAKAVINNIGKDYKSYEENWNTYRLHRNKVVASIRNCKRRYYEENIDQQKHNPTKMWRTLKELIGNKVKAHKGTTISFEEIECTESNKIAHKFNEFFVESIKNIIQEIEILEKKITYIEPATEIFAKFREVSTEELDKIICNLDERKGLNDEVTAKTIKMTWRGENRCVILTLINKLMSEGIVPKQWKNSKITPIPKIRGSTKAEDHRPVNTLPVYEKDWNRQ